MRHRRKAKYFGVKTAHRKAMFRNMVTSLFRHGRITTTVPRAKELRRLADRLVTLAKDGTLHARRQALSIINDKEVVARLFSDIADQMISRNGGYTRIVRIGPRRGDGAMMCMIELVKESLRPGKSKILKTRPEAAPTVIPEAKEEPSVEGGDGAAADTGIEAETASEQAASSTEEEASDESRGALEKVSQEEPSAGEDEDSSAAQGVAGKEPGETGSATAEKTPEPAEETSESGADEKASTEDAGRKE